VTDDRDRDEAPVIKVTDKRRFANVAEAEGPERPSASGSDEPGVEETLARPKSDSMARPSAAIRMLFGDTSSWRIPLA